MSADESATSINALLDRAVRTINHGDLTTAAQDLLAASGSRRFRHELFREVAAESAPPSLRRNLHERTRRALAAAATDAEPDWRVVAGHLEGCTAEMRGDSTELLRLRAQTLAEPQERRAALTADARWPQRALADRILS